VVAVILLALSSAVPLTAQRLVGTVSLPGGRGAAVGVIVVATKTGTTTPSRALTGSRGEYTLALPGAGSYDVRVLRIGYRPTDLPPVEVAASETQRLDVTLGSDAIALTRVTVRGKDECRARPDSGVLVLKVWDEARKALLASRLAAGGSAVDAERIEYERTYDVTGTWIREQHVRATHAPTTRAFVSIAAERLASAGYVVPEDGNTMFYAPDADVLLSDSFAATHCLRVEPAPAGAGDLIGVGFRPVSDERGKMDITGTLWLDRPSAELRYLDYRYTNLPEIAVRSDAGGRVDFLRLPSGHWLVNKWVIRMPRIGKVDLTADGGARRRIAGDRNELKAVITTGGQVTAVMRGDSAIYRATGAALYVRVTSRDSTVRVQGATLALTGTHYQATVDSAGIAHLQPVLDGRYRATLQTPDQRALGVPPLETEIEVRDGASTRPDALLLPGAWATARIACGVDLGVENSVLHGVTTDSLGNAVGGATVTAFFQSAFQIAGEGLKWRTNTRGSISDDAGRFRLCDLPRNVPIVITAELDRVMGQRKVRIAPAEALASLELPMREGAIDSLTRNRTVATTEVLISDVAGTALPATTLEVMPAVGRARTVVTDARGRVLIPDMLPGAVTFRAKRPGYAPGDVAAVIEGGRNTIGIRMDKLAQPSLDTVRVIGSRRVTSRFDEFETRRARKEATASFSADDIDKRNPTDIVTMLYNVPSVKFAERDGVVWPVSTRGTCASLETCDPCNMRIMLDGMILPDSTNLNSWTPKELYGIEVFAGPATIPPKYRSMARGTMCGLIALWTK
jgi:hypothetical protein